MKDFKCWYIIFFFFLYSLFDIFQGYFCQTIRRIGHCCVSDFFLGKYKKYVKP